MKFRIHWRHGGSTDVEGDDIAQACNNTGIGGGAVPAMDYYEQLKEEPQDIAGKANCGCVHHAEEGTPCVHDIALARHQAGL